MITTIDGGVLPHNERPAVVWGSGGKDYEQISEGIADSIEHCVSRLHPMPGERILDLSTGTGWASRVVARRGAKVTGVDIAGELLATARVKAEAEALPIVYRLGDAESLPFEDGEFDAVVSTYGIMFASRPEAAARELARVWTGAGSR
jgi:ubiquinone/menaquinone biosynthesis C-methylase UbiE